MTSRPQVPPDPSSFSGRVLSTPDDFIVGDSRFPDPPEGLAEPASSSYEACSDSPPFVPLDRSECVDPLAYADWPGPSTFFLRATSRNPSPTVLKEAERDVLSWPLKALPPEDREEWRRKVLAEAVRRTEPSSKILSGLFLDGRVLLTTRAVDSALEAFLSSWFGAPLRVDPVLWPRSSDPLSGRSALLCVLDEELARRKTSDRGDFSMEEARVTVGSSTIKGPLRRTWTAIRSLFSSVSDSDPVVDSAVLCISGRSGPSRLFVDKAGLFRTKIPAGRGGLPRDRAIRLLRTFEEVSAVARKELRAAASRQAPG